MKGNFQIANSV